MIAEDGHCKPFDKDATGTLFSDGAGVVALRRLEDAVEAGDTILAVIKGYALNNDGSDKAGFTAPSVSGQSEVIQMAQAFGDVEPDSITYIEAHGTATPLGDPIEIAGLTQAFRARTEASQFCALGSVKSNIGHLDVAAGIAGFIKTVLALHHREIPPTIHFTEPNPKIDFSTTPFYCRGQTHRVETTIRRSAAGRRQLFRNWRNQRARGTRGDAKPQPVRTVTLISTSAAIRPHQRSSRHGHSESGQPPCDSSRGAAGGYRVYASRRPIPIQSAPLCRLPESRRGAGGVWCRTSTKSSHTGTGTTQPPRSIHVPGPRRPKSEHGAGTVRQPSASIGKSLTNVRRCSRLSWIWTCATFCFLRWTNCRGQKNGSCRRTSPNPHYS